MALSLKERLASRPDLREKTHKLESADGEEVVLRRLSVVERNAIVGRFNLGTKEAKGSDEKGVTYGIAMVAASLVPPLTEDDVLEMPATIVDELAKTIMDFNGWTERSRKELADEFRPSAGSPV